MGKKERRRHPRVDIDDPISYLCVDSDGQQFAQNMGIARNVSQSGIFIETFCMIETEYIILAFADLESNITEIKGKVVYSKKNGSGTFKTGISFKGEHIENIKFIEKLIKYHHYKKENSRLIVSGPNRVQTTL